MAIRACNSRTIGSRSSAVSQSIHIAQSSTVISSELPRPWIAHRMRGFGLGRTTDNQSPEMRAPSGHGIVYVVIGSPLIGAPTVNDQQYRASDVRPASCNARQPTGKGRNQPP